MKVKRKLQQQGYRGPSSGRVGRRVPKAGSRWQRFSTFIVATGLAYYNKLMAWRHAFMDGLP